MGKKKVEEMAEQRAIFTQGAVENQIDEGIATYIFDLMEKFAGYGFNKSHSAAYALVAYQTAWLKTHYPAEFMAAVLSSDMDNTDKVVILIDECRENMQLEIIPPNINRCAFKFTVNEARQIVYGIGAIKGVGQAAIEDLLNERDQQGEFADFYDLVKRVDLRKVNRRVLEALIRAGAFDVFDDNRASHLAELPIALKVAEQHGKMAETGQNDLFGLVVNAEDSDADVHRYATHALPWPKKARMFAEKQALGLFLTDHPIAQYKHELKQITQGTIAEILVRVEGTKAKIETRLGGLLVEMRTRQDRKGKIMGFATLDDRTSRLDVAIYSEVFERFREQLKIDNVLIVEGSARIDGYTGKLSVTAEKLYHIEEAREKFARCLMIDWTSHDEFPVPAKFSSALVEILQPFLGGQSPVVINYQAQNFKTALQCADSWRVHPSDELIERLEKWLGEDNVLVKYR
jgi:DNA polymerase-3 subunit alpha